MKIVINRCYGAYGLSEKAVMRYAEISGKTIYPYKNPIFGFTDYYTVPLEEFIRIKEENPEAYSVHNSLMFFESDIQRTDPILIQVVEELGKEASDEFAKLKVIEIPDDIEWNIRDYDGMETIVEQHRSWS